MRRIALFLLVTGIFASCGPAPEAVGRVGPLPDLWAGRPESARWTDAALAALDGHGAPLVRSVPADIEAYCPAYPEAGPGARKAFWVTFVAALARHESGWRPDASGGDGRWLGLLQIAPETAAGYGCGAQGRAELKDGAKNLACGIRIMAVTVPRDGVISAGMRGVAADWAPFREPGKLADIRNATRSEPYCAG